VWAIEDISACKQAERESREKEARFILLPLSPLPVMSFADREHIVVVGEGRIEQCGCLRDDLRRVEDWMIRAYREHADALAGNIREIMIVSTETSEGRSVEPMTHAKKSRPRMPLEFVCEADPP
jgi:hypothetical protein